MAETEPQEPPHPAGAVDTKAAKRLHKATYARDKKKIGKYLIRVIGPTADKFEGRTVPVTRMDDTESMEKLTTPVWSGIDEETQRPVALYHFEEKEREAPQEDDLPF